MPACRCVRGRDLLKSLVRRFLLRRPLGPGRYPTGTVGGGQAEQRRLVYPVHIASVWESAAKIEITHLPDGQQVIIASGRFYLWQQQSQGRMVEFMADNVVLYLEKDRFDLAVERRGNELGSGQIRKVYLSGNIVLTEADRTVLAYELFYDLKSACLDSECVDASF